MQWNVVWRVLALSLLAILTATEAPVLHHHGGRAPAFYDAECPLSQLVASRSEAGPTQRVELTRPLPVVELIVLPALPSIAAQPVLPFDPRGPPPKA
jgi:hypothetical protein